MNEENGITNRNNELISVIVPIYKTDKYLSRCIESIISQTYKNIEIILVGDGTTEINDIWKKRDNRISIINQQDQAADDARNIGLDAAAGEYIAFVASDDYVHNTYVEKLYLLCDSCKADIAICSYDTIAHADKLKPMEEAWANVKAYDKVDLLKLMNTDDNFQKVIMAWNKLYRKAILNNIRYPGKKTGSEGLIIHNILYHSDRIAVTEEILYYCQHAPNSVARSPYNLKQLDLIEEFEKRNEFYVEHNEIDLYRSSLAYYMLTLRSHYFMCRYYYPEDADIYNQLWQKFRRTYKKTLLYKEMTLRNKLSMTVTLLFREHYLKNFIRKNEMEAMN